MAEHTDHAPGAPIVVSGATGALGSAIVERLVGADHPVIAIARSQDALDALGERFPTIRTMVCDLSKDTPVIDDSRIGGVVQAAGAAFGGSVLDIEPAAVLGAFDLKINGLLRLIRAVDGALFAGSRIIALGGNLGFDPVAGATVPGITNAALANLIRQLSQAYGPRDVTAHLVSPGPVDTERLQLRAADEARFGGTTLEQIYAGYAAPSPLSRLTTPGEVAWAVRMLFDPEAAALTGSTLLLDAGLRTAIP